MRAPVPFALAAVVGFGAGFGGARFVRLGAGAKERHVILPSVSQKIATSETTDSRTPAKERIAAILALVEKTRTLAGDHEFFRGLQELEARDLPVMAEQLLALNEKKTGSFFYRGAGFTEAWMDRWLEVDEAGALKFLGTSQFLEQLSTLGTFDFHVNSRAQMAEGGIFKTLARRQPEWTRQYVAALKPGGLREIGTYMLLNEAARKDQGKAKVLLTNLGEGASRPAALQGYIAGLAVADVRAGFATALAEPAGPLREDLLMTVMSGAAKRGLGSIHELLAQIEDPAVSGSVLAGRSRGQS